MWIQTLSETEHKTNWWNFKIIQGLKSLNLYKIVKGTVNIILKGPYLKITWVKLRRFRILTIFFLQQLQNSTIYFGKETSIENIQFSERKEGYDIIQK